MTEFVGIVVAVYLAVGGVLLLPFHLLALPRLDSAARGASWGFRIVISPGLIALWPLVLLRVARGTAAPHPESTMRMQRLRLVQRATVPAVIGIAALAVFAAVAGRGQKAIVSNVPPAPSGTKATEGSAIAARFPQVAGSVSASSQGGVRYAHLAMEAPLAAPLVWAYWIRSNDGDFDPEQAVPLALVWGPAEHRIALPEDARAGGLVLFSLLDRTVVDRVPLAALGL